MCSILGRYSSQLGFQISQQEEKALTRDALNEVSVHLNMTEQHLS